MSGAKINDNDLVCNILLSLPKLYETITTVIENTPNLTYSDVKSKLLSEYEKRRLNNQPLDGKLNGDVSTNNSTAFYIQTKNLRRLVFNVERKDIKIGSARKNQIINQEAVYKKEVYTKKRKKLI